MNGLIGRVKGTCGATGIISSGSLQMHWFALSHHIPKTVRSESIIGHRVVTPHARK